MKIEDILIHNKNRFKTFEQQFKTLFKCNLSIYWDYIMGFDIIKFDEDLIQSSTQDNISMKEMIIDKYGLDAAGLIMKLIKE